MRNIKLLIEYDGSRYVGWQRQESGKSIQGEIESVLRGVLQENVNVVGAGRTDGGVHARGQAANFRTETKLDSAQIENALNALLPNDIVIYGMEEVPMEFHARYSAKERRYSYLIARVPTALQRQHSWYVKYVLDVDLIKRASDLIIGTHDFESFCKANSDVEHHRCNVRASAWKEEGSFLRYTISADRFLHGMVRALVGTMVDVGRDYTSLDELVKILEKKDRKEASMAAPARGLVLEEVIY